MTVSRLAGADEPRFQRLDAAGLPLAGGRAEWHCVLDRRTGLVWEVKTRSPGLHHRDRRFRWAAPGEDGNDSGCAQPPCDTRALLAAVNRQGWCGAHDWRLPDREELRSLVDYTRPAPGPLIDERYFPNTPPQFHWSATPSAADADEAWGIGFTFGFDYAYFTEDRAAVRLVRGGRHR